MKAENLGDCVVWMEFLFKKLTSGGLTEEEFVTLGNLPVGQGSVRRFVELNLEAGNFEWQGNLLVNKTRHA